MLQFLDHFHPPHLCTHYYNHVKNDINLNKYKSRSLKKSVSTNSPNVPAACFASLSVCVSTGLNLDEQSLVLRSTLAPIVFCSTLLSGLGYWPSETRATASSTSLSLSQQRNVQSSGSERKGRWRCLGHRSATMSSYDGQLLSPPAVMFQRTPPDISVAAEQDQEEEDSLLLPVLGCYQALQSLNGWRKLYSHFLNKCFICLLLVGSVCVFPPRLPNLWGFSERPTFSHSLSAIRISANTDSIFPVSLHLWHFGKPSALQIHTGLQHCLVCFLFGQFPSIHKIYPCIFNWTQACERKLNPCRRNRLDHKSLVHSVGRLAPKMIQTLKRNANYLGEHPCLHTRDLLTGLGHDCFFVGQQYCRCEPTGTCSHHTTVYIEKYDLASTQLF